MDVKYVPADWEKMKSGIGNLIGLGVYGKGMIDDLKDISSNLEDAESAIAKYDSDGVISFKHTDKEKTYQNLFEDFKVLHRFTGKVGDIVDRTIDQPFYEDIDAFVAEVQQLSISNYKTKNRIGVTRIVHLPGSYESTEVPKTEVGLDDLFSSDSFYAEQMKLEYEAWKQLNADQDITQEDYQMGILNTRAFGYESIRNQQENKEFWVNIAALVVIVGVAIVCPPAGLALGAVYGSLELKSAISGEDWVSGRELGTGERWFRGVLAPLDIIPGAVGIKRFSGAVRSANIGGDLGQLGLKSGVKTSLQTSLKRVDDMVVTAGKQASTRLKSAGAAIKDTSKEVQIQLLKRGVEAGRIADTGVTAVKNIFPSRQMGLATDQIGNVHIPAENTHFLENLAKNRLSKIEGLNVDGKVGSGAGTYLDDLLKQTKCSSTDLQNYLKNIDAKLADEYVKTGKWPSEIQVPKDSGVLTPDGKIDWSQVPNDGFKLNKLGEPIKNPYVPKIGEVIDRYGPSGGRFTSPVDGGTPYSYDQRSLPYIEDASKYHQYEITGDFSDIKSYYDNSPKLELRDEIDDYMNFWGLSFDDLKIQKGEIAQGFGSVGGGIQYQLPLPTSMLESLGLLKSL